jgi:hypothetical protein
MLSVVCHNLHVFPLHLDLAQQSEWLVQFPLASRYMLGSEVGIRKGSGMGVGGLRVPVCLNKALHLHHAIMGCRDTLWIVCWGECHQIDSVNVSI